MSLPRQIKGVVFMTSMLLGVIACTVLTLPWLATMPVLHPAVYRLRRAYAEALNMIYFLFNATLILRMCGTSLFIHSASGSVLRDRDVLFLCNHRTRVDWMYAGWAYAACLQHYPCLSFVLKNELKTWPFFGWCMQMMMYIFLTRRREQDLPRIAQCLSYLAKTQHPSVFLFPEGTDLSANNLRKSEEYAKTNNLPLLEYVLYPKYGGLQVCLKVARERKMVVHNITIAYKDFKDGERTSELSLLQGKFPKEVHLFVEKLNAEDIPEDDVQKWVERDFIKKDELLAEYYEQSIPNHKSRIPRNNKSNILQSLPIVFSSKEISLFSRQLLPCFIILFSTIICGYALWKFWWFRYVVLIEIIFYVIMSSSIGVDSLEMAAAKLLLFK